MASIGCFALMSLASLGYGVFLLPLLPLSKGVSLQRPIQLLFGFFIFNTLLFVLVILRLMTVQYGFFLLAGIGLLGFFLSLFYQQKIASTFEEQLPGVFALLLSGIGATLLCSDPLSVPLHENGMIYFPIWGDSFLHARFISAFAQADGGHQISAVYMSGMPLSFYHYASYLMPAAVVSLTGVSALVLFSCFLIPVGVFLLGLAGFTLAHAFWKGWPAVAATVAVVFLPDAYYQGFQIKFLSYHFHLHVGPASFYGLGCGALAWLFMIQGCRDFFQNSTADANCGVAPVLASSSIKYKLSRCAPEAPSTSSSAASFERSRLKKLTLIFTSWFFLGVMLIFKAQFFVANAFILLLFPCFFFLQCEKWKKFFVAGAGTLFFTFIVHLSQRSPSVPLIALNGGGIHKYCKVLSQWTDVGVLHSFLLEHLWLHPLSFPWFHLLAGSMLYFCTLGFWGVGIIFVLFFLRRKVDAIVWSFPLWMIVNYLVMAMGLSMDPRHLADPEELLNRPLMWVYFAVVTWTTGGLYFLFWRDQLPKTILGRLGAALLLGGSLFLPLTFAHGLQTMPIWNMTLKGNAVPVAMIESLEFIKQQSHSHEIIQGSEVDPLCVVSSLSERQNYVMIKNPDPRITERLKEMESFKQMRTEEELKTFTKTHPIAWYLLRPETKVAWPDSFKNSAVFESGGYRVYHWPAQ